MSSLQNVWVSDGYVSLLHSDSVALPATGKVKIYDGSGQASALSMGLDGNGATISGALSANTLSVGAFLYPSTPLANGSFVVQKSSTELGLSQTINSSVLEDLSPSPSGVYTKIEQLTVNAKGLITDVTEYADENTVTATVYRTNAGNPYSVLDLTNSWSYVTLPANFPATTKGIIGFIKPTTALFNDQQYLTVESSPDAGTNIFPVVYCAGGESSGGGSDSWGSGGQFYTKVGTLNGSLVVYFRVTGSATNSQSWNFHIIAYQL